MNPLVIAVIGAGNMGKSLIVGLLKDGHPKDCLWAADPNAEKLTSLASLGIHTTHDNLIAINAADIVIFAVKPQTLAQAAEAVRDVIQRKNSLVISIAAGIRVLALEKWLGSQVAIVRTMPNTPAMVGCGATALYANTKTTPAQCHIAESVLRSVGVTVWLDNEKQLDIVTALSGSGPAYFFLIMEAMQKAAESFGLPSNIARTLTLQTALGAAHMAIDSEHSPIELRKQVTSPGGTTEKAITVLEEANIHYLFNLALHAAKIRSEELANLS